MPPKRKSLTPHEAGCADISQSVTPANAKKPRARRVVEQRSEHGEPRTFSILLQLSVSLQSLLLVLKSDRGAHHALGKAVGARFSSSIISSKFKRQRTPALQLGVLRSLCRGIPSTRWLRLTYLRMNPNPRVKFHRGGMIATLLQLIANCKTVFLIKQ